VVSCSKKEKVTITKDFIINPNWNKNSNSIQIERKFLKDGKEINLSSVSPNELLQKLETDTSFAFTANVKENGVNYSIRKVYFNEDNGFKWRKRPDLDQSRDLTFTTIGKLKKETWYFLGGLSKNNTLYYIYIDSSNRLHQHKVSAVHWTNI